MPHRGALRNSSGPTAPWLILSPRPEPMWCKAKSENGWQVTWSVLMLKTYGPAVSEGEWHRGVADFGGLKKTAIALRTIGGSIWFLPSVNGASHFRNME
jgi:hypothetical protein